MLRFKYRPRRDAPWVTRPKRRCRAVCKLLPLSAQPSSRADPQEQIQANAPLLPSSLFARSTHHGSTQPGQDPCTNQPRQVSHDDSIVQNNLLSLFYLPRPPQIEARGQLRRASKIFQFITLWALCINHGDTYFSVTVFYGPLFCF